MKVIRFCVFSLLLLSAHWCSAQIPSSTTTPTDATQSIAVIPELQSPTQPTAQLTPSTSTPAVGAGGSNTAATPQPQPTALPTAVVEPTTNSAVNVGVSSPPQSPVVPQTSAQSTQPLTGTQSVAQADAQDIAQPAAPTLQASQSAVQPVAALQSVPQAVVNPQPPAQSPAAAAPVQDSNSNVAPTPQQPQPQYAAQPVAALQSVPQAVVNPQPPAQSPGAAAPVQDSNSNVAPTPQRPQPVLQNQAPQSPSASTLATAVAATPQLNTPATLAAGQTPSVNTLTSNGVAAATEQAFAANQVPTSNQPVAAAGGSNVNLPATTPAANNAPTPQPNQGSVIQQADVQASNAANSEAPLLLALSTTAVTQPATMDANALSEAASPSSLATPQQQSSNITPFNSAAQGDAYRIRIAPATRLTPAALASTDSQVYRFSFDFNDVHNCGWADVVFTVTQPGTQAIRNSVRFSKRDDVFYILFDMPFGAVLDFYVVYDYFGRTETTSDYTFSPTRDVNTQALQVESSNANSSVPTANPNSRSSVQGGQSAAALDALAQAAAAAGSQPSPSTPVSSNPVAGGQAAANSQQPTPQGAHITTTPDNADSSGNSQ